MQVKEECSEANKHSHKLTRMNLHACSICGRFIATTHKETKNGELVIEELLLEVKIVSSRIRRLRISTAGKYAYPDQPSDAVLKVEDTCW